MNPTIAICLVLGTGLLALLLHVILSKDYDSTTTLLASLICGLIEGLVLFCAIVLLIRKLKANKLLKNSKEDKKDFR